jgi:FkbM family methyltransferase
MAKMDPSLLRNAQEVVRPGDVVWDIGANIGLFTFAAAALTGPSGHVVAFEPDAWLVQLLRRSGALQSPAAGTVEVIPAAVASGIALRPFNVARRSRAYNALANYGLSQTGGYEEPFKVPAYNLDWLADHLPKPNVIKCDVEGAEIEVFKDQSYMLGDIRPVVVCEVAGETAADIVSVFREYGYKLYDGGKPLLGSRALETACWDTIAIPEELAIKYT